MQKAGGGVVIRYCCLSYVRSLARLYLSLEWGGNTGEGATLLMPPETMIYPQLIR